MLRFSTKRNSLKIYKNSNIADDVTHIYTDDVIRIIFIKYHIVIIVFFFLFVNVLLNAPRILVGFIVPCIFLENYFRVT